MATVTIGLNNLITSDEAQDYLRKKLPDFQEHTFRNAINLKHLKPAKIEKRGNKNVLYFDPPGLESFVRYRAELKSKRKAPSKVKEIKSPDLVSYTFDIYKEKIDVIGQVLSKEQLDEKLKACIENLYAAVKSRLEELEAKKLQLIQEIQKAII